MAVANGEVAEYPLDDTLIPGPHRRICADLTPHLAGRWRTVNVIVGTHEPPDAWQVAAKMRDYGNDLGERIRHLPPEPDEAWLELLAFAEGRLLSIHPFVDFNGRATRLFIDLPLQRLNLPVVEPIPSYGPPTDVYLATLRADDRRDWRPLAKNWRVRLEEQGP